MFYTFHFTQVVRLVISCLRQGRRQPAFEKMRKEKSCYPWLRQEHSLWLLRVGCFWVSPCNCALWRRKLCVHQSRLDPSCRSAHFARDSHPIHGLEAAEVEPEWATERVLTSVDRWQNTGGVFPIPLHHTKPCTLLDLHFCRNLVCEAWEQHKHGCIKIPASLVGWLLRM